MATHPASFGILPRKQSSGVTSNQLGKVVPSTLTLSTTVWPGLSRAFSALEGIQKAFIPKADPWPCHRLARSVLVGRQLQPCGSSYRETSTPFNEMTYPRLRRRDYR